MDYPLHMRNRTGGGFAVANDADEHQRLSESGYEPKYEAPAAAAPTAPAAVSVASNPETVESLRAQLDAAGIAYDRRWGIEKLKAALPE